MYIVDYKPFELTEDLASCGKNYIVRRFQDVWGIDRSHEIDTDSLISRRNLVAFEGHDVIGWLGVAPDGELVHGCGGPGRSSFILIGLLDHLLGQSRNDQEVYYAYVPVDYLASAACCIKAGMSLPKGVPVLKQKAYEKKIITLIRLAFPGCNTSSPRVRLDELKQCIQERQINSSHWRLLRKKVQNAFANCCKRALDWSKQYPFVPITSMAFAISLVYYAIFVLARYDIPSYVDFLTQKKSEQDREELLQYLSVSEEALKKMNQQISENVIFINGYIGNNNIDNINDDKPAFFSDESVLNKQQTSMKLFAKIIQAFSSDISKGIDSADTPIRLYAAVLQYLSDDNVYDSKRYPYNQFAKEIKLDQKLDDCLKDPDCVREQLEEYIDRTITHH